MHELHLMKDLMRKLSELGRTEQVRRISRVRVWLGALSHMSPEHFREHFDREARGSLAEGAELQFEVSEDQRHPQAQGILLTSIDVEE